MNVAAENVKGVEQQPWSGRYFYRYRAPDPTFEIETQILKDNKLYFSTPDKFDDPDEAKPRFTWGDMSWATPDYFLSLLRKREPLKSDFQRLAKAIELALNMKNSYHRDVYIKQMEKELTSRFQRTSICCFCESAENETLWSRYAADGSGYCVGFSFDQPWIYDDHELRKAVRLFPYKVIYQAEYPRVDADCLESVEEKQKFAQAALLTKSLKWKLQREWRCFRPTHASSFQSFPTEALRQLILGPNMAAEVRSVIIELARKRDTHIDLFVAKRVDAQEIRLEPM